MMAFYLFLAFALVWYLLFRENFLTHTYGISTGTTRNMSYDIRGDPPIIPTYTGPWNQSTIRPIRNRRMVIGMSGATGRYNPFATAYNDYEYFTLPNNRQLGNMPTHFYDNYYYQHFWNPQHGILT